MGLNIKNERVCALAKRVAAESGQTQTAAIESALERYLEALLADTEEARRAVEAEQRRRRAKATLARIQHKVTEADRVAMAQTAEDLYDEVGLPR